MPIPDEDVAKVRAATDIVAVVGEHTALKRVGRRFVGLCPFHAERTGSFSVNPETGLYYCFGCRAAGDAISFVRAVEGCDFVEAVERLAARAGIAVRDEQDGRAGAERGRRKQLYEALSKAVERYHERLLSGAEAGRARQYLRSRGYDAGLVRQFRLGWAGSANDDLVRSIDLPAGVLVEAGLAWSGRGRLQDAFRERVIFPIFDAGGRAIALGGRVLPPELRRQRGDQGPKYRNSPESSVYQKRRTLYGLNWAKGEVTRTGEVVVCEGYTDVIGFFQAGVPRAVATCGTALTEEHLRLLSNFARRVVLAFDADSAGQSAAARLYEWERRHDVELAVASLPAGRDPADLARLDPAGLAGAVAAARPFLAFEVDRALQAADLRSPEGRSRAAESALDAIAQHPSELVRDQYLVEVADRTQHDPERLRPLLEQRRRRIAERARSRGSEPGARPTAPGGAQAAGSGAAPASLRQDDEEEAGPVASRSVTPGPGRARSAAGSTGPRAGLEALALAIHRPAEVAGLLEDVLFTDPLQREAFAALEHASELHEAVADASPQAAELLTRLGAADLEDDADPLGTYLALCRLAGERALSALKREARLAAHQQDPDAEATLLEAPSGVQRDLELLRDATDRPVPGGPAMEAARRLVAWLERRERDG